MKKETKKIAKYDCPEAEVIFLKMESLICKSGCLSHVCSGDSEGTEDEELEP